MVTLTYTNERKENWTVHINNGEKMFEEISTRGFEEFLDIYFGAFKQWINNREKTA
jgi:hypothetical protein